ncbi:MAG: hypothetical protein QOG18_1525 [Microbacteriaceae bacterium]|nr:hypothetical protein [Microbacteriaceae bacterium]
MNVHSRLRARLAAVAMVAAVGLAITGCVGIPTSGAVLTGTEIKAAGVENGATYLPEGPAKGASQQQILQGFISAFASSQNNYAVAREFLGSGFKDTWDPRQSVLVRTGAPRIDPLIGDTMSYTIDTLAVVDSSGTYTPSPDPQSQSLIFQFAKQKGQWRITEAPQGIVLLESTFESIFSAQTLYFLDPSGKRLVPDQRWFPTGAQTVRIVSALLAGPSAALRGAVYTAFPEGTKLSSPLVPIQNAVATIDLSVEALNSKTNDRQLMRQQLLASLGGVSSIAGVSISVGDSLLPIPDSGQNDLPTDPQVDPRPLVLQKDSFGFYEGGRVTPIALSSKILALKPTAVTLSSSGTTAAVLTATGGVSMVTISGNPVALDTRPGLVSPTMDEDGYLWSVPSGSPNAIRVFDSAGKGYDLTPALPPDSRIVSIEVSRDGARVAMYLSTNAGPRIIVSAIVRSADQNQRPLSLVTDSILDATAGSGTPIDATWVDGLSVATLSIVNGQPTVYLYQLGGSRTSLGRPDASSEIVGGNGGTAGLRLLAADGSIEALRGSSWISSSPQVGFIAVQR